MLQLSESGGLQLRHLGLLHDNWKEVLLRELRESEQEAEHAKREHREMSVRLRKREDDVVLLLQSYESLRDEHAQLACRVSEAEDGGSAHAARLQAELEKATALCEQRASSVAELHASSEAWREKHGLRERQLALVVTHLETARHEAELQRSMGSVEEQKLHTLLVRALRHPKRD